MPKVHKNYPVRLDKIHSHYRNTPPGLDARMRPEKFNCKSRTYIDVGPGWSKTERKLNIFLSFLIVSAMCLAIICSHCHNFAIIIDCD